MPEKPEKIDRDSVRAEFRELRKRLGLYLRQKRRECGFTQIELSELTGMAQSYLSGVENGKKGGLLSYLLIFKALGISLLELFRELER